MLEKAEAELSFRRLWRDFDLNLYLYIIYPIACYRALERLLPFCFFSSWDPVHGGQLVWSGADAWLLLQLSIMVVGYRYISYVVMRKYAPLCKFWCNFISFHFILT